MRILLSLEQERFTMMNWNFLKILGRSRTKLNTGPKAEYRKRFFEFFPHVGLFCHFFSLLHKLNSQNLLFTVLSCFKKKKKKKINKTTI